MVAPREELGRRAVGSHGRVRLVLRRVGVAVGDPARSEVLIKLVCFVEVFAGQVELLDQEVVTALQTRYG